MACSITTESGLVLNTECLNELIIEECTAFYLDGIGGGESLGNLSLIPDYIYFDQEIRWKTGAYVIKDLDIFYDDGQGVLKWYRVQGACMPCAYNSNCDFNGLQVIGKQCAQEDGNNTKQQFLIQNILASNIREVCNILTESKLNWEICSIKVYTRPADPSLSGPEDVCNTLIDVPFENIPECITIYVRHKPIIKMGMTAHVIEANYVVEGDGEIITGGEAIVTGETGSTSLFEYVSEGQPNIIIGSLTEYDSSWENIPLIQTKMSASLDYFEAVLNSKETEEVLTGVSFNVRTLCGSCTSMPSSLYAFHNFAKTTEVKNFLNSNEASLPDKLLMKYSKLNKMWTGNHQMLGTGDSGREKWNFVFNWQCTNSIDIDAYEDYNSSHWKFSIFVNRLYLDLDLDFDTKIHIIFPPDYLCDYIDNLKFNFPFSLNTVTKYVKSDFVHVTEEVVLEDNVGLFKDKNWQLNPKINITLTGLTTLLELESKDLTPIIPVALGTAPQALVAIA